MMHFSFILLRIKSLYIFRALLTHPKETLHKLHLVYCVRIMSVSCNTVAVSLYTVGNYRTIQTATRFNSRFAKHYFLRMLQITTILAGKKCTPTLTKNNLFSPCGASTQFRVTLTQHIALVRAYLDQWSARPRSFYVTIHNTHFRGIGTYNPSIRGTADPRLRHRGQWYQLDYSFTRYNSFSFYFLNISNTGRT
jgi:hypothetical protein